MTGLFGTLNTGTKGLHAAQHGLQTTSHNVSNANTEGYSRQRVTMEADLPMTVPGVGQLGTGVLISSVNRVTDNYLVNQVQKEQSVLTTYEKKSEVLGQLEAIYNEPSETGLNTQLGKVFASWTNLGSNPEMATAKTMVMQQTQSFTDTVHHMATQMDELRDETVFGMEKQALDFNSTIEQLDSLNQQIFNVSVKGQTPNDLLDQRDRLLGQLNEVAGVEKTFDKFNRVFVKLDEQDVLTKNSRTELSVVVGNEEGGSVLSYGDGTKELYPNASEPKVGTFVLKSGEDYKVVDIPSGAAKGAQEALDTLHTKKEQLNEFAYNFAKAVNTIHQAGDENNQPFFTVGDVENAAHTISVDQAIQDNPGLIAAGKDLENISTGDGSRAQAISRLQNTKLTAEFEYNENEMKFNSDSTGVTLFDQYNDMVTDMGIIKQQSDNMAAMQEDLVGLLNQRKESVSGVDMNEEVVDMIRFQSSFQANSRVISAVSEMLDTLINRTGV